MQNLLSQAYDLLKQDERLLSTEGDLLKNKIQELAYKLDEKLIEMLLSDTTMKEKFFVYIKDVVVFDQKKFVQFINNKQFLPDSYTAFKNKIGLTDSRDQFISESNDVVLDRPYKDCVLAGGQDKEDAKRDEIFYNEVLGSDQIDRLLDPKVFTNFKRYTVDGEQKVEDFTRDENSLIKDNLIIKGNNLLALHSLKKQFAGKVKLIYIDPPYNTGNDGFKYNDKFNHSSWLTFMKNRLEIARELLSDDGFITIQCDDYEQAYLKVLMDSVFDKENYRNSIYWHRTYAGKTVSKNLPWNVDIIHLYSKKSNTLIYNTTSELTDKDIQSYNKDDNDGRGKYNTVSLQKTGGPGPLTTYDYIDNNGKIWKCPIKGWRMRQEKLKALENDNRLYINKETIREKYYLNERIDIGKQIDNFRGDVGNLNRGSDTSYDFPGQKPEKLIERLINITTKIGDIVLDYHLGSGTTCAVAHKMVRQFIGIEQMDYIEKTAVTRIKKVIEGEQDGISKAVNRKGGGEFIYMEISQNNEKLIQAINNAEYSQELISLYHQLKESSFINYKIDIKTIDANISDFENLSGEDMKRFLIELIDKNALYINYSEINDESYAISAEDKALNKKFYQ